MKRAIKIIGSITMWSLLLISCITATKLVDFKNQPKYIYKYTDLNGIKGTSKHCFERDSMNVCKIGKYTRRVIELEKIEA